MKIRQEIPPTAGLPMVLGDWLPTRRNLTAALAKSLSLPPLLLECSGTAALIIALQTLLTMRQNNKRANVIIPAFSCPLVVLAIRYCGLNPVLCDTENNSFDFNFLMLERLINEETLVVMPTHIGGQVADVLKAARLAHGYGAVVIEDCAQALGASVGQIGDIAFFSLAVGKGLTLYEGGLLTAKSETMRQALTIIHNRLNIKNNFLEFKRILELAAYSIIYRPALLPYFYGWPRRQALKKGNLIGAVGDYFAEPIPIHRVGEWRMHRGARAARRLDAYLTRTAAQAKLRIEQLQQAGFVVVQGKIDERAVWPFLMVLMPDKSSRDSALSKLWASPYGVTRLFIHSLSGYDYLTGKLHQQPATPNADDFADRLLTITNSLWLGDDDFKSVLALLQQAVKS